MQWNGPVHRNRNITVTRDHKIVYKVYHLSFTVTEKVAARGHKNNIIQIKLSKVDLLFILIAYP